MSYDYDSYDDLEDAYEAGEIDEDELEDEAEELARAEAEEDAGGGRGRYRGSGLKNLWRDLSGERIFGKVRF